MKGKILGVTDIISEKLMKNVVQVSPALEAYCSDIIRHASLGERIGEVGGGCYENFAETCG
jgi:hypothetical protein